MILVSQRKQLSTWPINSSVSKKSLIHHNDAKRRDNRHNPFIYTSLKAASQALCHATGLPTCYTVMCLKGQCQEIFDHFYLVKGSTWTPFEQAKKVLRKIFAKIVCLRDYANTDGKLWRLLTDFKGIIRQNKYLGVFTVYSIPKSNNLKIWKWEVT